MAKGGMWVETQEGMEVPVPAPKSSAIVVINEKHSLVAQQVALLEEKFSSFEELRVSESGWDETRIREEVKKLADGVMRTEYIKIPHIIQEWRKLVPVFLRQPLSSSALSQP